MNIRWKIEPNDCINDIGTEKKLTKTEILMFFLLLSMEAINNREEQRK